MSLYLKERIYEQIEDVSKDKVTFTYPWIIAIPPPTNENRQLCFSKKFGTSYQFATETWYMRLFSDGIRFHSFQSFRFWKGSYFVSYNLYYDNDMRFLLYSSLRTKLTEVPNEETFKTPDGFMTRMVEAFGQRKIAKIVVFIELQLPTKYFYRPYIMKSCSLRKTSCDKFPEDTNNNFRFGFLVKSDYTIKCPDGSMPARRMILNLSSEYMKKHFEISEDGDHELTVEHSIDVVGPVVTFMHTFYFKMPKVYDLDFAKRLLIAIDFFKPEQIYILKNAIHLSLCQKFGLEPNNFDSILQWTSLASRHSLHHLQKMVATVIVDKYFFKWHETFPENARNFENPLFLDIFGSENATIFARIVEFYKNSFLTNEHHDFDLVLKWAGIASLNFLRFLESMIATIVADKFYLKWHETFPQNARNNENPTFLEVFGPYDFGRSAGVFNKIEKAYNRSFLTNVILD